MALVVRVILWSIVVLAPGGLLLLPFLAVHHLNKAQRSDMTANNTVNSL